MSSEQVARESGLLLCTVTFDGTKQKPVTFDGTKQKPVTKLLQKAHTLLQTVTQLPKILPGAAFFGFELATLARSV